MLTHSYTWHDAFVSGHTTIADSQYLHASLSQRILGAYYLGCEMSAPFKESLSLLFDKSTAELTMEEEKVWRRNSIKKVFCSDI